MKKFIHTFAFLIVIACLSWACQPSGPLSQNDSFEDKANAAKVFDLSDADPMALLDPSLIDSIYFVALSSNDGAAIGEVDKLLFDEDLLFVLDSRSAEAVFVFTAEGQFLRKIGNKGKGPGEYLIATDISLDTQNKILYLLDLNGRKIHSYTYEGAYLASVAMPFLFTEFEFYHPDTLFASTLTASNHLKPEVDFHHFAVSTLEGELIRKDFVYTPESRDFTYYAKRHFTQSNGSYWFFPLYSDRLYEVNSQASKLAYAFDFGTNGFSEEERRTMTDQQFQTLEKSKSYFNGGYVDVGHAALFEVATPTGMQKMIYFKEKDQWFYGSIFGGKAEPALMFLKDPISTPYPGTFASIVNASTISMMKEILKRQAKDGKYDGLEAFDNPVVFFYRVRK
jgi:hypothetical protein